MIGETKLMWMELRDHRLFCDDHKPDQGYQVEVSQAANCWKCLREIRDVKA